MIVVNFFHSKWASARGINGDIGLKTKTELDANLRLFYAEARNKDGENCKLLGFRSGLDRNLNNPPYKKGIHIATDPAFQQSNKMLETKLKDMKKHGEQNVKHKFTQTCATEREDLTRLKESAVITSIQCLVSCQPVFQFCRRGQEGQRNLTKSSFLFLQDENSEWYATMGHDEASKTRRGGIDDTATNYEKLGRMYQRAR